MKKTQKLKRHWRVRCGDNLRYHKFGRSLKTIQSELCAGKAWRSPMHFAKVKARRGAVLNERNFISTDFISRAAKHQKPKPMKGHCVSLDTVLVWSRHSSFAHCCCNHWLYCFCSRCPLRVNGVEQSCDEMIRKDTIGKRSINYL